MKYINEIFDLLLDKTIYSKYGINKKAKYWKMGTSFITMFDRLREKLENVDISYPMISVVNYENKTTQGNICIRKCYGTIYACNYFIWSRCSRNFV